MGTRSLTFVYDEDKNPLINMYAQYDGYPEGHGRELAEFLTPVKMVNGITRGATNIANGMGCLAAQLVAHFKQDAGGFYLYPVTVGDCGQDYEYHIYADKIKVKQHGNSLKTLFAGSWEDFAAFCSEKEEA